MDVALIIIKNDFIQKKIDNEKDIAIIKSRGILVDMLLDISPGVYGPYINMNSKVIMQLINQCMNAIYATMVTSPLFYCKFFYTLKLNKFKMNTYDPCVANL